MTVLSAYQFVMVILASYATATEIIVTRWSCLATRTTLNNCHPFLLLFVFVLVQIFLCQYLEISIRQAKMGLFWPFVVTEVALDRARLYPLSYAVRGWNKFWSENTVEEKNWIKSYEHEEKLCYRYYQDQAYLLETLGALEKSRSLAQDDGISSNEDRVYTDLKTQLDKTTKDLCSGRQQLADLLSSKPRGAYIREFDVHRRRRDYLLKKHKKECRVRGGCCDRDCGCCDHLREVPPTMPPSKEFGKKVHCSIDCGCCIRFRGFTSREVRGGF